MTGINHALTGVAIGLAIDNPILAIPLAFVSHFALDLLPHFGQPFEKRNKLFKTIAAVDIFLTLSLIIYMLAQGELYLLFTALVAMSPDFAWVYRFVISEKFGTKPPKPTNRFNQMHTDIQQLEFNYGFIVEAGYFLLLLSVISGEL